MTSYKESQRQMSRYLSQALDDIGVIQHMTDLRRHIRLLEETMMTIDSKLQGGNETIFIVGSQSEGTTTIDMDSDTDHLFILNGFLVVFDWGSGQIDPRTNRPPSFLHRRTNRPMSIAWTVPKTRDPGMCTALSYLPRATGAPIQ